MYMDLTQSLFAIKMMTLKETCFLVQGDPFALAGPHSRELDNQILQQLPSPIVDMPSLQNQEVLSKYRAAQQHLHGSPRQLVGAQPTLGRFHLQPLNQSARMTGAAPGSLLVCHLHRFPEWTLQADPAKSTPTFWPLQASPLHILSPGVQPQPTRRTCKRFSERVQVVRDAAASSVVLHAFCLLTIKYAGPCLN